jgi:hypothetical protein
MRVLLGWTRESKQLSDDSALYANQREREEE